MSGGNSSEECQSDKCNVKLKAGNGEVVINATCSLLGWDPVNQPNEYNTCVTQVKDYFTCKLKDNSNCVKPTTNLQ